MFRTQDSAQTQNGDHRTDSSVWCGHRKKKYEASFAFLSIGEMFTSAIKRRNFLETVYFAKYSDVKFDIFKEYSRLVFGANLEIYAAGPTFPDLIFLRSVCSDS